MSTVLQLRPLIGTQKVAVGHAKRKLVTLLQANPIGKTRILAHAAA
jgi:hypothetical protein